MAEARFKGTDDYIASPDLQAAVNVAVALEFLMSIAPSLK